MEEDRAKEMRRMIHGQNVCVLATVGHEGPHCSFMAYIADDDCRTIHMITHRDTKKYTNLTANPSVSLLVDNRNCGGEIQPREKIHAMTLNGLAEIVGDGDIARRICSKFIKAHGHLQEFATHENAVVFAVKVESIQLQRGAMDGLYRDIR